MDPMMSKTFDLGKQEHFNDQLRNEKMNFTYLVPTDQAWDQIKTDFATAYKILFMGDFFYQTRKILERHIKIGSKLSLADMTRVSEEAGGVGVLRGAPLTVHTDQHGLTTILYDGLSARIVRPDIECSNGYIHLIDRVVMKRRDVTLGGTGTILPSLLAILSTWILSCLLK